MSLRSSRSLRAGLASVVLFAAAASPAQTQTQSMPSVPAAAPASAASLPSVAPATSSAPDTLPALPAASPATVGSYPAVPAATPVEPVQAPPTASPSPQTSPTQPVSQDGYQDPLQQPLPASVNRLPAPTVAPEPSASNYPPRVPVYEAEDWSLKQAGKLGSTYIPVDSPVYPAVLRLHALGYLDSAFIGMRPYTRLSLLHILQKSSENIVDDGDQQAMELLAWLEDYLAAETPANGYDRGRVYGVETLYARTMGIKGQSLRDSFHLGQTIVNDYGRPYEPGFNALAGFSSVNEMGRFSLYVRGEYQHSAAAPGYSLALASQLSCTDFICPFAPPNDPQATIPYGTQLAQNPFRLQEATLSFHLLGHEISGGKSDAWNSPAVGGAMMWSNNAEDIYSFRINRVEPLYIPYFSRILGPLRYDFFVGSLKGHTAPNSPWIHSETISLHPTSNFEFAFQRSVIFGGEGHQPVTLHTFLKSFFSFSDTTDDPAIKDTPQDPGDRFSDFTFSWRLPYLTHSVTLYLDSISHDDVSPVSAPRRAAYRPGLYIAHLPGLPKMDFRIEGASTDSSTLRSLGGKFLYAEAQQLQGYTNKGYIIGDWMGREAKGGQAWLTYNLAPGQWIQAEYLTKQTAKDFVAGGVTQSDFKIDVVKRVRPDVELNAWVQFERWSAPVPLSGAASPLDIVGAPLYLPNGQHDTTIAAQLTWYPKLRTARTLAGK